MVRKYLRRTARASLTTDLATRAINEVLEGASIRKVAEKYAIPKTSLSRYVNSSKVDPNNNVVGYKKPRQTFTDEQEQMIVDYIIEASNIYFGLTPTEVRKLSYDVAIANEIDIPSSWITNAIAGREWFASFIKRHPISVRKPEATSSARATNFNPANVKNFFDKLVDIVGRYEFSACDIWNLDETGITNVQKCQKKVGKQGTKQVGGLVSYERGELVTLGACISATGASIPPFFVFPRKRYHDHFVKDAPVGSAGTGNASGWMDEDSFYLLMKHFVRHVRPSIDRKVLLLLDNHQSHLSVKTLNFAKENGVVMLSFPPHCSHKLQPLDRTIFGVLKNKLANVMDTWQRVHPGHTMTIYEIPGFIKDTWHVAASTNNCVSGFRVAGIWPVNPDIFSTEEFAPSTVTDRPAGILNPVSGQSDMSQIDNHLKRLGKRMVEVAGDGHCLLEAVTQSLSGTDKDTVSGKLLMEVEDNIDFYRQFASGGNVMEELRRYVVLKEYNTDTCDLIIDALCSALSIGIDIYTVYGGKVVNQQHRPRNGTTQNVIEVALFGNGAAAHYCQVEEVMQASNEPPLQAEDHDHISHPATPISPKDVRPLPKMSEPRKVGKTSRKKRHSAVLTDTPIKQALEEEERKRKRAKETASCPKEDKRTKSSSNKRVVSRKKITYQVGKDKDRTKKVRKGRKVSQKKTSQKLIDTSSENDDDKECFCLVCTESYSRSKENDDWIQCIACKGWSHVLCTNEPTIAYVCDNCDSDDDL